MIHVWIARQKALKKGRSMAVLLALLSLALFLSACTSLKAQPYTLAALDEMPFEVKSAPEVVQQAYRFAAANPEVLTQLPCYCGCGSMGHTSNLSCYVSGESSDGNLQFDSHALGCTICVDITQDAMRMLDEGKALLEIRTFIDQTYSPFGPSNMP